MDLIEIKEIGIQKLIEQAIKDRSYFNNNNKKENNNRTYKECCSEFVLKLNLNRTAIQVFNPFAEIITDVVGFL